jgi:membrane associated rhomboid family serine protease
MIPLRDENPTHSTPVVTILLIVANVAVYIYQVMYGLNYSALAFGLIPAELVHNANFVFVDRGPGVPDVRIRNLEPAWATIFTSMFMHGNFLHILGNMWYLWIFGNNVEDAMGKVKFLLFYLFCGVAAAVTQIAFNTGSQVPMVGASGALAGVLGAYLVLFPGSRVLCLITTFIITTIEVPAFIVLGLWILLQVVSGVGAMGMPGQHGGVAYAAHVGGFVAGWLVVHIMGVRPRPPRHHYRERQDYVDWR